MIDLNKMYTEGQRARRPNRKFFKKHEKKVRVANALSKAINQKKK